MESRRIAVGNYIAWARESRGYLRRCRYCERLIYLHLDGDSRWRPYAAWVEGDCAEGEWILHDCEGDSA
jgi:hypothetical protein